MPSMAPPLPLGASLMPSMAPPLPLGAPLMPSMVLDSTEGSVGGIDEVVQVRRDGGRLRWWCSSQLLARAGSTCSGRSG